MKVVIDTNIVVSAVLKDRDPEMVIRFVIGHPQCEWVASRAILSEYTEVLRRPKFGLPDTLLQEWSDLFDTAITLVDMHATVDFPRDQKDATFLACAIAADADYLITGDQDFSAASMLLNTLVCTVAEFKHRIIAL